jgi:sulfite dehydrogenase (quinone) subunit SoeC
VKPALSVIFFTVFSGAGLGLAIWTLIASTMQHHIRMDLATFYKAIAIAVVLTALGLISSTLHLANRKNAVYALTQWKTSWLSREGVFALLFFPLIAMHLAAIHFGYTALAPFTMLKTIACALAILYCTGMIYACLKTVPRWNTWMTPAKYVVFGLMSGAVLFTSALSLRPVEIGPLGKPMMALFFLAAGFVLYLAYLLRHPRTHTIESALGVTRGQVRMLDVGHSHGTFLTNEFGFRLARDKAQLLRWLAILWAFVMPFILLAWTYWYWVASVFCIAGLLVERWLFFAEAEHVVRLYHGQQRVGNSRTREGQT